MSKLSEDLNSLDKNIKKLMLNMVNENKDHTQLLLSILEQSTDGYWDWHIGSKEEGGEDYEYLSPKFKKQLGYEEDELPNVPSSWMNLCNEEDLAKTAQKLDEHFNSLGEEEFITECRYTHKDGHTIWILCRGFVTEWDESNAPKRMVGTHTDITNLKK